MSEPLVSPRFMFQFSIPCRHCDSLWTRKGTTLAERHAMPNLSELERPGAAPEIRVGWNAAGLAFRFEVRGKRQSLWCRAGRPDNSDGVQIWIDTRDVKNVHRASRFCHRLYFLPAGDGPDFSKPSAGVLPINRARSPHGPIDESQLKTFVERSSDGYVLHAAIDAAALTGYDPSEYARIGFNCAVIDRELGEYTLGVGRPMPYQEDPSLWPTLELVQSGRT